MLGSAQASTGAEIWSLERLTVWSVKLRPKTGHFRPGHARWGRGGSGLWCVWPTGRGTQPPALKRAPDPWASGRYLLPGMPPPTMPGRVDLPPFHHPSCTSHHWVGGEEGGCSRGRSWPRRSLQPEGSVGGAVVLDDSAGFCPWMDTDSARDVGGVGGV